MKNQADKPDQNSGAGPVPHVPNGDPGDRGVLNDAPDHTAKGKEGQEQYADRALGKDQEKHDDEDIFDLESLKGNTSGNQKEDRNK